MHLLKHACLVAVAVAATSAWGDGSVNEHPALMGLDIDGDNLVSKAEAAGYATVTLAFDRADRNRDGQISREEWERYERLEERRAKAKEAREARQARAAKHDASASSGASGKKARTD